MYNNIFTTLYFIITLFYLEKNILYRSVRVQGNVTASFCCSLPVFTLRFQHCSCNMLHIINYNHMQSFFATWDRRDTGEKGETVRPAGRFLKKEVWFCDIKLTSCNCNLHPDQSTRRNLRWGWQSQSFLSSRWCASFFSIVWTRTVWIRWLQKLLHHVFFCFLH